MSRFKKNKSLYISTLIALIGLAFHPTGNYPKGLFRNPVGHTMTLAGNFGELRPNHFHAGLDIKGQRGEPVYAAADGYVSKIQVLPRGYGKVIYVTHPNGYTTAYAHLDHYVQNIERIVFAAQKAQESFEIIVTPKPGELYVHKGDVIAYVGMTGTTYGPHLHFEIRVPGGFVNPWKYLPPP